MVVWPGAPKTEFQWRRSMEKGDQSNNSNFFMNSHSGTHVDAPLHFFVQGKNVGALSLDPMVGESHVLDFSNEESITVAGLKSRWPKGEVVDRLLLKTKNSFLWEKDSPSFVENFCALREAEARWLLEKRTRLIGIDSFSIQYYKESSIVHQLLLEDEVVIIEGLNLSRVTSGKYELFCLPLKLQGLEASPARVILRHVQF